MNVSEKCPVCGKRGKRPCPATGGLICPACCGSHRGSKLNCPAECGFYPFGTAAPDLWIEVEGNWFAKTMRYVEGQVGRATVTDIMARYLPSRGARNESELLVAYFPTLLEALIVRRDAGGKTLADRWEADQWAGLNNDERVMMSYRRHSCPAVIEVQRATGKHSLECIDLLEPNGQPFNLVGNEINVTMPRFTKLLVWLTRFPHFHRIGAAGYEIPDLISRMWFDLVQQQTREAQQARPDLTATQFVAEHMAECVQLIGSLLEESRKRMLETLDAHHCVADYTLVGSVDEVKSILDGKPDFASEEPASTGAVPAPRFFYRWLRKGESAELSKDLPAVMQSADESGPIGIVGNVRVYDDRVVVETVSKVKYEFVRKFIDKHLGHLVRFKSESVVDLAKQLLEREKIWPEGPGSPPETPPEAGAEQDQIPPEARRKAIGEAHTAHYRNLLDSPVPELRGLSPRAAAQDASLRPTLVKWLKGHVHHLDTINRRDGLDLNIDWVLDELGVPELK